jgi:hypothetical protein
LISQVNYGRPRAGTGLWAAEDAVLRVDFAADGRAAKVEVGDTALLPRPSLLDRLRARLGL